MPVTIERRSWTDPEGAALRLAQETGISLLYGRDDSEPGVLPGDDISLFLVAVEDGAPVGCGALRALEGRAGEVKRMFVVPSSRGSGVAAVILRALEVEAAALGWVTLRLETGDRQLEAIRFYEREGYVRIPNYGVYADSEISLCYEKDLV